MKLPLKIVPFGSPQLPMPFSTNVEPVAENVPPHRSEPLVRAPVEKVTEPRSCPLVAVRPLKDVSSDRVEVMPKAVIEIEPY
jgi:hypothetical protein